MAAELQTVSAVFDLLKLAWSAGLFLKKVSEADSIALEVHERVERLSDVLEGVRAVLQRSRHAGASLPADDNDLVEAKVYDSLKACSKCLKNLEQRLEGFSNSNGTVRELVGRFRTAWRHPSIVKGQNDLEARISILQTNLVVLQLFDQAKTHSAIGANQVELLQLLENLGKRVEDGNNVLLQLVQASSSRQEMPMPPAEASDRREHYDGDSAVSSLTDCLRTACDVYERYTSEYVPDDGSLRLQNRMTRPSRPGTPLGVDGPADEQATPSSEKEQPSMSLGAPPEVETNALPLRILDRYVADYRERARTEIEKSHFNQAETCLDRAARYSEARERQYGVPFSDKVQIGEELASVYQSQGRWAEAVSKLHEMMRENSQGVDEVAILANARQNQLLASVYFDRHVHSTSAALHGSADDLETAERHAHIAFAKRDGVLESAEGGTTVADVERDRHQL
ncbi:hypothetical protein LTR53_003719, partial [Teratosphaeriaceae sp. CCFEE 6253]